MLQRLSMLILLLVALLGSPVQADEGGKRFRGQLHAHSYWSDGRGFPDQAVAAYKQRGYDFFCLSDHNRLADDPNVWRKVVAEEGSWPPNVTQANFDACVQAFGRDWVESKTEGAQTSVRLKTYAEIKAKFDEPGRFLFMPGVELTQTINGYSVHMNYINLPEILPCIKGSDLIKTVTTPGTVSELIGVNATEAKQMADKLQRPYLLMLNHPLWVYYDVAPQNLIDNPGVRFFEVCNGGSDYAPHPETPNYNPEKFWDVVNAFRCEQNQPLLYGIGSDDAHFYDEKRINDVCGVGDAWVMVHAESLTPEHLLAAMQRGDFYASSGVLLNDVAFHPANKTLRVKVQTEPGVKYRIHFITTKRGFDRKVAKIDSPAGKDTAGKDKPGRVIPLYSEDIGRAVKTVEGDEAEYCMEGDDLYVRASIESDAPAKTTPYFHSKVKMAWTQPYSPDNAGQ
jgi:hypothetical protein